MTVSWQHAADVSGRVLQQRGLDPEAVTDVDAAWAAFEEFVRTMTAARWDDETLQVVVGRPCDRNDQCQDRRGLWAVP